MNAKIYAENIIKTPEENSYEATNVAQAYLSQEKKIEGLVDALEKIATLPMTPAIHMLIAKEALTAYKEGK